ncbi:hypothetical protein HMF8227_00666 [Saliniradius amylolyticus]|uniref:ATP-binding protein n=1 Tax=Saliniradius amylolyticus TaxID=2183582 RepID=A0A2S2E0V3_9ALTE|nr:ATP-binding protein [Saliniradius amylolyticus]AWL11162.1 hypothetical protein HMF8227_00666 [Saliniradius amylolyticus]
MAGLQRIILVATHLPGVVELKLDGHTNVCGTNASGKTTLQRLIPVFYGELPSKVVPRTRKKFSEFYLPHNNSYLIYEYQREDGRTCQAVVMPKDSDSVQYRFVDGPFEPEQVLVKEGDGHVALTPDKWLQRLKALDLDYSNKIHSTSEYRSVIQNDASVGRANSRDNTRLRQLAARYSLVSPTRRIRHMEKLVSAVHAKEGKMDTLRTMLAAIFEEDGLVQPATQVRSAKVREWISQMRQSRRLSGLHEDFHRLKQQAEEMVRLEQQLYQLKPLLGSDFQRLKTERADDDKRLKDLKEQLSQRKQQYQDQSDSIHDKSSEIGAELSTTEKQLEWLQSQYDRYLDADMEGLAQDVESLPVWRDNLQHKEEQHRLLLEQHQDMERELLAQKTKLADALERLRARHEASIADIEQNKEALRHAQHDKEQTLRNDYEQRRSDQQQQFEQVLTELQRQRLEQENQANQPQLTESEQEQMAQAEERLEQLQQLWQQALEAKDSAERQWQKARTERERCDQALNDARQRARQARDRLNVLENQLKPAEGSLRQYLREHMDGWEHRLGKVIHAPLLERKDLAPEVLASADETLMGLKLELGAIDLPDYAQDEATLKQRLTQAKEQLAHCLQVEAEAEEKLQQAHELAEQQRAVVDDCLHRQQQAKDDMGYARDARQRLQQEHKQRLKQRREQAEQEVKRLHQQLEQKQQEQAETLSQLKQDFQQQLLEYQSGWQAELDQQDDKIRHLRAQVEDKRQQNAQQMTELEAAFNQQLAEQDIDPKTLSDLKQAIAELQRHIQQIAERQDELSAYRRFMQVEWQQRPELLDKESGLRHQLQQLKQQKRSLRDEFEAFKIDFNRQKQTLDERIEHHGRLLFELEPLLKQLGALTLTPASTKDKMDSGDQAERISRCNEALGVRHRLERQLKDALTEFENQLTRDAGKDFLDTLEHGLADLGEDASVNQRLTVFERLLQILESRTRQIVEQGETIGGDLHNFFTVFADINRRIASQSKRLTDEVADDLTLDGIHRSEVRIVSTVDELNFWQPLQVFARAWKQWRESGREMPDEAYLEALGDVVDVLPSDARFNIESLLRLELRLNEGGSDLVIKNDRQLLESSSHGMAYLILCKFLLAFTRLLRGQAEVGIHWPIDEIGTLAYHNVEKLFNACDANGICIMGAFPNPESDVLMLFRHRYLIDKEKRQLQQIQPKVSPIREKLKARQQEVSA